MVDGLMLGVEKHILGAESDRRCCSRCVGSLIKDVDGKVNVKESETARANKEQPKVPRAAARSHITATHRKDRKAGGLERVVKPLRGISDTRSQPHQHLR